MSRGTKGKSKASFESFYQKYNHSAYRTALSILKNKEDAQDILQEAFLKVKEEFSKFNPDKSFSSWFFKIVSNLCRNYLHKRSTTQEVSLETFKESGKKYRELVLLDNSPNPLEALEKKEEKELLKELISSLPSKYKEALTLKAIKKSSIKKIAQDLKISPGAVKMRLKRGRKLLRQRIKI